ncbi:unnamed protein product [Rotaria sp. Silwood2]|nr:unnamed protein product [Rotaria sp. Silwood2]CAF2899535.1 unnamed protein product [Rotaria sp. Silwood2]
MATAQLGFSFNSSQFLSEMFRSMFPDSQIAVDYSLRERKLSYVISHGTGYYFTNELIKDVRKAYGFSLLFDETSIAGVRKQLDIFFRYWSEAKNCICVRFYKSIILGHVTADIISRSIIDSLKADGIDITKMLMLELIKSLPIKNDFLRHLQCLQPSARKEQFSRTSIMYLARNLPHLLTNEEVDRVGAEWRVYEMADTSEDWIKNKYQFVEQRC